MHKNVLRKILNVTDRYEDEMGMAGFDIFKKLRWDCKYFKEVLRKA